MAKSGSKEEVSTDSRITQLTKSAVELNLSIKELSETIKEKKAELDRAIEALTDHLSEQGIKSVRTSLGYTVYLTTKIKSSILIGSAEDVFEVVEELGGEHIIKRTIANPSWLSFLKEQARDEDGDFDKELLPDELKTLIEEGKIWLEDKPSCGLRKG